MILFTHKVSKREKKPNGRVLNVIGYLKLIYENPNLGLQQFSGRYFGTVGAYTVGLRTGLR